MVTIGEQLAEMRLEIRHLRIKTATLERARAAQKDRADKLEEENKDLRKENEKLKEQLEKAKEQRDKFKGMIFKPNTESTKQVISTRKRLGGQLGHRGASRKLPEVVDQVERIYFHHCPDCGNALRRTDSVETHTVCDLPAFSEVRVRVSEYQRERQWCSNCQKEVVPTPPGVIPHSRLGINLIIQILIWKYVCRMSLEIMVSTLAQTYGVEITESGLVNILKRTKRYLGEEYGKLLEAVRDSPVKQADETSWRINGLNGWLWVFLSKDSCYYTIEHTRGKGVAEKALAGSKGTDVLVRDDYAGYKKLKVLHQSCWRHLLGESKEVIGQKGASKEAKSLHHRLKKMYKQLERVVKLPFDMKEREAFHQAFEGRLKEVIDTEFISPDTRRVQTRIKNQGNNLITAIVHPDVPLTNNLAERQIRPAVVIRKISGGSRSDQGAESFAINMSIIQSLKMRNQPLVPTLRDLLLHGALGNTN